MPPEDLRRLEAAARGTLERAILLTFIFAGTPKSEFINLDLGDLDHGKTNIRVPGKSGKERLVPVSPELRDALEKYLAARPDRDWRDGGGVNRSRPYCVAGQATHPPAHPESRARLRYDGHRWFFSAETLQTCHPALRNPVSPTTVPRGLARLPTSSPTQVSPRRRRSYACDT